MGNAKRKRDAGKKWGNGTKWIFQSSPEKTKKLGGGNVHLVTKHVFNDCKRFIPIGKHMVPQDYANEAIGDLV
jgi:hypothetical protein